MIGDTWYYVSSTPTGYEIKTAKVIGETPRKWILRELEEIDHEQERMAAGGTWITAPGEGWHDWAIPKKGEPARDGHRRTGRDSYTRPFFASLELSEAHIATLREEAWARKHRWKIGQQVERLNDLVLLRKIADLIGYKEEKP